MSAEVAAGRGFDSFSSETLEVAGRTFTVRRAAESDVPALVGLLRDDVLGATREASAAGVAAEAEAAANVEAEASAETGASGVNGSPAAEEAPSAVAADYQRAFALIVADPNQLLVAVEEGSTVVGTLQLSLVPSLSRRGALRLQIEAVRVDSAVQGIGLGTTIFEWAHDCGRRFGARLAQLTTDLSRTDAQRFYARLGYVSSHAGLKLSLD